MLVEALARRLQGSALRALVLELHIARMRGELPEATSEERLAYFATAYWEKPGARADFLRRVPALARRLASILSRWVEANLELLARLAEDQGMIRDTFFSGKDLGDVAALETGAGDLHRGGRSVARLAFASGRSSRFRTGARAETPPRSLRSQQSSSIARSSNPGATRRRAGALLAAGPWEGSPRGLRGAALGARWQSLLRLRPRGRAIVAVRAMIASRKSNHAISLGARERCPPLTGSASPPARRSRSSRA